MGLFVTRREQESLVLIFEGKVIEFQVSWIKPSSVSIKIDAPQEVQIFRKELLDSKDKESLGMGDDE
jgi:sRNA-binding carbon storage regulator CsrA